MATATYINQGYNIDYTPGTAKSQGDIIVLGDTIGVVATALAANEKGSLRMKGLFSFPKLSASGTNWAAGTGVYWDNTDSVIRTTPGASNEHNYAGVVAKQPATTDTTVEVLLGHPSQSLEESS